MTNRQVALIVAVLYSLALAKAGNPWPSGKALMENAVSFLAWLER